MKKTEQHIKVRDMQENFFNMFGVEVLISKENQRSYVNLFLYNESEPIEFRGTTKDMATFFGDIAEKLKGG